LLVAFRAEQFLCCQAIERREIGSGQRPGGNQEKQG